MLAHAAAAAAVRRDADLPLNLKAEETPLSPCPGTTMCEDYHAEEVSQQTQSTQPFLDMNGRLRSPRSPLSPKTPSSRTRTPTPPRTQHVDQDDDALDEAQRGMELRDSRPSSAERVPKNEIDDENMPACDKDVEDPLEDDDEDIQAQDLRHSGQENDQDHDQGLPNKRLRRQIENDDEDNKHEVQRQLEDQRRQQDSKAGVLAAGLANLQNLQHLQSLAGLAGQSLQGLQGLQGLSQGIQNLQGLQGLSQGLQSLQSLQGLSPGLSQGPPPQLGLNAGPPLGAAPLNLSLNAAGSVSAAPGLGNLLLGGGAPNHGPPAAATAPPALPQLILASGQMVQGIQGAQLLIPTSHGIATQTILTIPVNHVSSGQLVNLALSNGQVVSTTLAHLHSLAGQQQNLQVPVSSSGMNSGLPAHLTNGSSLPHQGATHHHHHQQSQPQQHPSMMGAGAGVHLSRHPQHHRVRDRDIRDQRREHERELERERREHERDLERERERVREREASAGSGSVSGATAAGAGAGAGVGVAQIHPAHRPPHMMSHHHYPVPEKSHGHGNGLLNGIASSISRLAANNCDLTITTTSTPSASASPPHAHNLHNSNNNNTSTSNNNRHSPPHIQMKGNGGGGSQHSGSSTGALSPASDLLDDNPNQPTINQTNTNMVDGINLDEIKEFAKAFKLRRLSLGLTQTQVGQALSITEGPAYSQSAICSALATQMICAAQIANQRPYEFEKLDITPKSAQKIKPVLEHWMKEAEERYKIGQNHLTEFIGMEPSKKRKRRTSFTPQALELLNAHFERNTHPSGTEITALAHQLGYDREVIRIWFCNKRQALKNTVRMMSKGLVS